METALPPRSGRSYLVVLAGTVLAVALTSVAAGSAGRDHFAAIRAGLGPDWYQDMGGRAITEIQDQDLFFHDIGGSVRHARDADVVIVGSSLVAFAINGEIAKEELDGKYGLSFFNMAFIGISSGEFTRLILEKYGIQPRLLIINADDGGGGGNFFGTTLLRSFSSDVKTIGAIVRPRWRARLEVARRDLLWRAQWIASRVTPFFQVPPSAAIYRSASSGNHDMSAVKNYDRPDNTAPPTARNPDCHTTAQVIDIARRFVGPLRGHVMLTLVPNTHYCARQAQEVADALGIELVITGRLAYSTIDNGGHLDRRGSVLFTRELMQALEKTETFRRVLADRASGARP